MADVGTSESRDRDWSEIDGEKQVVDSRDMYQLLISRMI